MGRRTKYQEDYARQARYLAQEFGATNEQLAGLLNCSTSTLQAWQKEHEEFSRAIKEGKAAYDDATVELSLLACARGYWMYEYKWNAAAGQFQQVPVFHPPQYRAIMSWLHNRRGWLFPSQQPAPPALPPAEGDPALAALRSDPDFQTLAQDLMARRYQTRLGNPGEIIDVEPAGKGKG